MRRIIFVPVCVFLFFLIEFILFNMFGSWFMPNLLLLLVIYFNFSSGIRYSIFAAVLAGILKDCFSVDVFGLNIFYFCSLCVLNHCFKEISSLWYFSSIKNSDCFYFNVCALYYSSLF